MCGDSVFSVAKGDVCGRPLRCGAWQRRMNDGRVDRGCAVSAGFIDIDSGGNVRGKKNRKNSCTHYSAGILSLHLNNYNRSKGMPFFHIDKTKCGNKTSKTHKTSVMP